MKRQTLAIVINTTLFMIGWNIKMKKRNNVFIDQAYLKNDISSPHGQSYSFL